MTNWKETLFAIAPTVATALGTPLAGAAVSAIGSILGLTSATPESIASEINSGKLMVSEIKKL